MKEKGIKEGLKEGEIMKKEEEMRKAFDGGGSRLFFPHSITY